MDIQWLGVPNMEQYRRFQAAKNFIEAVEHSVREIIAKTNADLEEEKEKFLYCGLMCMSITHGALKRLLSLFVFVQEMFVKNVS